VCPFLPLPFLLFTSWQFPGLFRLPWSGADRLAASLFGRSWIAPFLFRHILLFVVGGALGEALMRQAITLQWLFSFLCTMNQTLLTKLNTFKKISILNSSPRNSRSESNFIQTQVLFAAYHQIFGKYFAAYCICILAAVIYMIFILVSPAVLPSMITFILMTAGALMLVAAFMVFDEPTVSHIRIQQFILANREKFRRNSSAWEYKFWRSMKPPHSTILGLCTFETKEFLLIVLADVVISAVVNLLLAF